MGAITKTYLMNEIMFVYQLKSHVRRDFSIAGVKVFQNDNQENLQIHGFGDRTITCLERISDFLIIRTCASHRSVSLIGSMTWKTRLNGKTRAME
jgi:hypothetical protein